MQPGVYSQIRLHPRIFLICVRKLALRKPVISFLLLFCCVFLGEKCSQITVRNTIDLQLFFSAFVKALALISLFLGEKMQQTTRLHSVSIAFIWQIPGICKRKPFPPQHLTPTPQAQVFGSHYKLLSFGLQPRRILILKK